MGRGMSILFPFFIFSGEVTIYLYYKQKQNAKQNYHTKERTHNVCFILQ
jgi:hypothetical protein